MMRRVALLGVILVAALLAGCSKSSERGSQPVTFLKEGKIGALKVVAVKLAPGLAVSSQETAEKLDPALRPADPAATRNVVLELTIGSDAYSAEGSWQPFPCGAFVLTYDGGSAPCVGLSLGDQWVLADSGSPEMKLIYYKADETREEQLLFLVPKGVESATLELKSLTGPPTQVARVTLP